MIQHLAQRIEQIFKTKGFIWYTEPFKMNIIAVRSKNRLANSFDDQLFLIYKERPDNNSWVIKQWKITTDPGTRSLRFPINRKGTAILVEGQYVDTHAIDYHQGKYKALCQRLGKVKTYRDTNRNNVLDLNPNTIVEGMFGINIHKAGWDSTTVEGWSAGCLVFKRAKDFAEFMQIISKAARIRGNKFTISLLREEELS